jgi:Flp pilus assembly protein protease CpaA
MSNFFPHMLFGWIFIIPLFVFLLWASFIDVRTLTVPKKISIPMFFVGVLASIIRGGTLGSMGKAVFLFTPNGALLGAVDGLLIATAGSLLGFVLFFILWIFGTCGGGDVKLFAALGAWVGPVFIFLILNASILVVGAYVLWWGTMRLFQNPWSAIRAREADATKIRKRTREINFSVPVTVATAVVLGWFLRFELGLAQPKPVTPPGKAVPNEVA